LTDNKLRLLFYIPTKNGIDIISGGSFFDETKSLSSGIVNNVKDFSEFLEDKIYDMMESIEEKKIPEDVYFNISGENIVGKTDFLRYKRSKPNLKIEQEEIFDVVSKSSKKALSDFSRSDFMNSKSASFDIINSSIVQTEIDGYEIKNPIGFQGEDLKIGVFNIFAPIVQLSSIHNISELIGLKSFNIFVATYSIYETFSEDGFDGFIFFVEENLTSFCFVKNNTILEIKSFSVGWDIFLEQNYKKENDNVWIASFEVAIEDMFLKNIQLKKKGFKIYISNPDVKNFVKMFSKFEKTDVKKIDFLDLDSIKKFNFFKKEQILKEMTSSICCAISSLNIQDSL